MLPVPACSEKEGENGERGVGAGRGGTWKRQESERELGRGRGVLENIFSVFTRWWRSVFLYVYGALAREAQRSTPEFAMVLTASTIHLFQAETFLVVF